VSDRREGPGGSETTSGGDHYQKILIERRMKEVVCQ